MKFIVRNGSQDEDRTAQGTDDDENPSQQEEKLEKIAVDADGNLSPYNPITNMTPREKALKIQEDIPKSLREVQRVLEERVGLNRSFDIVLREMVFGHKRVGIFYCNGFAKDTVLTDIITRLSYAEKEAVAHHTLEAFIEKLIPHIQVKHYKKMSEVVGQVLMGGTAFFIEGETVAITVDAKSFPVRSIGEPDLERVVRGSRDGFVETLLVNVTLVRRRIRDERLKLEISQIGKRTKTDVCLAYINDIADASLVQNIQDKLKEVNIDGLPLGEKQLEEIIVNKGWNPYPMVRYSERPDVVSAHLLEGHVCVFVDTSPSVMILPTTFFHHVQHAEEYRNTPFIGTYLRWVRFAGIMMSIFLLPLWYLIVMNPSMKPIGLEFLGPQKEGSLPLLIQFLIADVGIDLMRMAAVHTPTPLATAMGLVAAILVGDIAVKTGLFINEVILYLALASIGMFATPSYELGLANRIIRLGLLVVVSIFGPPGFIIGSTLWLILLTMKKSYNAPYMWPFIPFNAKSFFSILLRRPVLASKTRLSITKPIDGTRQPKS
ncbi:spore germination protein [Paenibacillus roseipurpureus]|uniref:Spore germination protein n=1 Tax=Paenibacillus roseopurpureus TaxID=2918901 RepID=A0AA96LPG5_9BACL|nr:spore germination protein [Paenibacillus sp. MBLB1832]WNR42505.1 spore germination protein [Paenibacillus sp. MBLB1832]